jgi:hypothetical protein
MIKNSRRVTHKKDFMMTMNSIFLFPNWPLSQLGDADDFVELLTLKKMFFNWLISHLRLIYS